MKRCLALLSCACFAACGSKDSARTQVMVLVDAQPQVRALARDVDFEVRSGEGSIDDWEVRLRRNVTPGDRAIEWPLEIALVPRDGDADRVYLAIATARDDDGDAVAQVRAISGYREGQTLTLLLLFEDLCIGKADLCNDEQTCRSGSCVDARVREEALPLYERDRDGKPVIRPFWDGGVEPEPDGGADAGSGDASLPATCNTDAECDDGDPCNGEEQCRRGRCGAGEPFTCPAADEPCRENVCVNDDGEPKCELQNAHENETCREGDRSDDPNVRSCARDYVCTAGECVPETVDTCTGTQCGSVAGCDPNRGCIYDFEPDTTVCDDGDPCTENDTCSGTDTSCRGTPKDCNDGVDCTVDACDRTTGACTNEASDALCSSMPCRVATCDPTNGCEYQADQDFLACDDGREASTLDLCYRGACVGRLEGAPTASCEVAGCGCTGFRGARDLDYHGERYIGLIEAMQTGGLPLCREDDLISIVYDVTPATLTPYTLEAGVVGGARWESSSALDHGYAVSQTTVGVLDPANQRVTWLDNDINDALPGSLVNLAGIARHVEGQFIGRTTNLWFWGDDATTNTTGQLVRCRLTSCTIAPCTDPPPTCEVEGNYPGTTIVGITPYTGFSLATATYGGVVAATNRDSGPNLRRIYSDGSDAMRDYFPNVIELGHNDGAWRGSIQIPNAGPVLVYGAGAVNLARCDDGDLDGRAPCSAITGLPNQDARAYFDAAVGPGGAVFLLATTCTGGQSCLSSSTYLVVLPSGADPTVGENWQEFHLATFNLVVRTRRAAAAVAAGGDSFMVLGMDSGTPYLWTFAP